MELGVPPTATHEEVRRAFRHRARETHPDHQPDDPHAARRFTRLRAAYEEALERLKHRSRGDRARPRSEQGDDTRRGNSKHNHVPATRLPMRANFPMSMKPSRMRPLFATPPLASSK